jgi:hypothetical protein
MYTRTYGLSAVTLYVGWDVSGEITVSAPGMTSLAVDLADHRGPPEETSATSESHGERLDAIEDAAGGEWCSSLMALFLTRVQGAFRGVCV